MEYRRLGKSELVVSEISLGSWLTYGGAVEAERARSCIDRAFDLGINFFDTANVYGHGAAESFLGDALAGRDRSSYVLATKAYFPMSPTDKGLSAAQVAKQSEASLRRLRTDHVDLYQCHRYDRDTPLEETMAALTALVDQGKARYIGFSEWTPDQIRAAAAIPGVARFVSSQPEYSILHRKPEPEVFPLCASAGIGQIVWSPLAQGALTGKYRPGQPPPAGSRAAGRDAAMLGRWQSDEVLQAVERLRPLADRAGLTVAQLALAWVLRRPEVTSAIVGASRPEQLDDNAAASGRQLDEDLLAAVDRAVEGVVGWG
ncbi:MAG TPA: aldo/keto reductase family protein [Acidimicrobiales bacterium]|nr:aldo/keto reductase family protein [Acidimicrobiales bacterium]